MAYMADQKTSMNVGREYTQQTQRERDIVEMVMALFEQLNQYRVTFASQWEEVAEVLAPNQRNTFYKWSYNFPGMKKTDRQIDASGMLALNRFGAIVDSLITPRNMQWHGLTASNPYVQKQRGVKLWFETATQLLFKQRYSPIANFMSQNQQNFQSLGAFGNMGMFIDRAVGIRGEPLKAIRYKALPIGEIFIRENHQGLVDAFIRAWRMTAKQAVAKFGVERVPQKLIDEAQKQSETVFDFFHCVVPNDQWDPLSSSRNSTTKKYASYYVSVEGRILLEEGGYNTFPLAYSRYNQAPQEVYGRGPGMDVLPALKTLNAEKAIFLKAGHRAADPILLMYDDGSLDFNMVPGAMNKGGVDDQGHELVKTLPIGSVQINKEMMDEERSLINDEFLVTLFQILTETPEMTATEVVERINEKGILLAPTIGRQQSEYLGPLVDRELDLMVDMNNLPPMPPVLAEARGEYEVVYTSPLSRSQRAQEAAGFLRTIESALAVSSQMQDPSQLDSFAFERAWPAIAEIQSVPESWMASPEELNAKRQARAQAQQKEQQIQAMPAQAAMIKAQATVAKANGQPTMQQQAGPPQQNQM
jgi:hypothetical protein